MTSRHEEWVLSNAGVANGRIVDAEKKLENFLKGKCSWEQDELDAFFAGWYHALDCRHDESGDEGAAVDMFEDDRERSAAVDGMRTARAYLAMCPGGARLWQRGESPIKPEETGDDELS